MFVSVNGRRLHYEKSGAGDPLILLHGNGEDGRIFRESIGLLQTRFTAYTVDLAGHGASDTPAQLHYETHAEDIAALILTLHLTAPVLYGFSDGGIVGLILAIRRPELFKELIVSGVNVTPEGLNFRTRLQIRCHFLMTRSEKDRLMLEEPHITEGELASVSVPVQMTVGAHDCVRMKHTRRIAAAIPGCRLTVVPHADHGSYIVHSEQIGRILLSFLPEA